MCGYIKLGTNTKKGIQTKEKEREMQMVRNNTERGRNYQKKGKYFLKIHAFVRRRTTT